MAGIPRYRPHHGPMLLSAGFRPFFLAAALWALIAIPVWLAAAATGAAPPSLLPPIIWHPHEMTYGYAAAAVAGFMLTTIPNWTGRMPLQGGPLAALVGLWLAGRIAVLFSAQIGAPAAAAADLCFPALFLATVAREIFSGRNWRNLPMMGALLLLLAGNLLVHLEALGLAQTAELGNRIGIGTLLMLIALVGGRLIRSFTRNWLVRNRPGAPLPAPADAIDHAAMMATGMGIVVWTVAPQARAAPYAELIAGAAAALRLARWSSRHILREPLLLILHAGYGWLAFGLLLCGFDGLFVFLPQTTALHALTVGAIGSMTLAVMTRAALNHTGRPLAAGPATKAIYISITAAALLRLAAPISGEWMMAVLWLAGSLWCVAFGLFAVFYGRILAGPAIRKNAARPV